MNTQVFVQQEVPDRSLLSSLLLFAVYSLFAIQLISLVVIYSLLHPRVPLNKNNMDLFALVCMVVTILLVFLLVVAYSRVLRMFFSHSIHTFAQ